MPVIKRYPNRKLYNTETKQYITLEELADLVRRGEDLHVVDNANGEDLTAQTMTQIIFELVKKQATFLPRTVLTGLIQAGGDRLSALQRTLFSSLGLLHLVDEEIRLRIQALIERGEVTAEEGERLRQKLLSVGIKPLTNLVTEEEIIEQALAEHGVATRSELQRLMDEIETLSAKLEGAGENNPGDADLGNVSPEENQDFPDRPPTEHAS